MLYVCISLSNVLNKELLEKYFLSKMFRTGYVLLWLSFLIGSVLSLKCYKENPDLAEFGKSDPNKDKPECGDSAKSCVIAISNAKGKPVSVTKGCTTFSGSMGCTATGVGDLRAVTCYCNKDMCNTQQLADSSARSLNSYISIGFLLVAVTVFCLF